MPMLLLLLAAGDRELAAIVLSIWPRRRHHRPSLLGRMTTWLLPVQQNSKMAKGATEAAVVTSFKPSHPKQYPY